MFLYNSKYGAVLGNGSAKITSSLDRVTVNKAEVGFAEYVSSYTGTITNAKLLNVTRSSDGLSVTSIGSGAQLKQVGVSGTFYGDSGWNTAFDSPMSFPYEARIKKEMCDDVAVSLRRGFCNSASLSTYVALYTAGVSSTQSSQPPTSTVSPTITATPSTPPQQTTQVTTTQTSTPTTPTTGGTTQGAVTPVATTPTAVAPTAPVTTTVTPVIKPAPITKQLKQGMTDPEVKILQQFLINQNLLAPGNVTGYFGAATAKALKSFQCTNLNVCSGTVVKTGYGATGPMTRNLINGMSGAN
jgi:hypothetical protein